MSFELGRLIAHLPSSELQNKNLGEESSKYWNVITNRTYLFRKYPLIAEEVKKLSKERVLRLFDRNVAKGAPHRQKLSVQVYASQHMSSFEKETEEVPVTNVIEFKRTTQLFPLAKSVDVSEMTLEAILAGKSDSQD